MTKNNNEIALRGTRVEVRNGDISGALRRFKKRVQDEGILQEVKNREAYEKPSVQRAKAKAAARSRWLKFLQKSKQD
jgi:small subunit ribosomal protein S21